MPRSIPALLLLALTFGGCGHYRLASLSEVEIPDYEPRPVAVPETCEPLTARAATEGMANFTDAEARELLFCQQQQIIRAQEEEAAAKLLESHAAAARFVLQTATVVVTGLIAVGAWLF